MKTVKTKLLTVKEINELVIKEAKKLKKNATQEEKDNLNFDILETNCQYTCIYGQMTGDCFNDRAVELIEQTCTKVLTRISEERGQNIIGTLNGSPKKSHRSRYWSPIEMFIDMPRNKNNGNNKRLIGFLKGKKDELKLK